MNMSGKETYRVGAGSGFAGDRYDPAEVLATHGDLDALVFECLAERTIAVAQENLRAGISQGFDDRILNRLAGTLPKMAARGGIIVTNAGAANPRAAAIAIKDAQKNWHDQNSRIASVSGDDVLAKLNRKNINVLGTELTLADYGDRIVSANAYIGADGIVSALESGADVVVAGRCADAALFVAPMVHHFGWHMADLDVLAKATLVGHLLECAGQLTGGYFADGIEKLVPDLWNLGFPFADVGADGEATYSKVRGTGGLISRQTVLEQLLYEIDNPSNYKTPDVNVDLTDISVLPIADDCVSVTGAKSAGRPDELKASVGVRDGFLGTGQIAYSGTTCVARAIQAGDLVRERWSKIFGQNPNDIQVDFVGVNSTRPWLASHNAGATEVIVRFGLRTLDEQLAIAFCQEVESLYTNGPAAGGGASASYKSTIGIVSVMVPRDLVELEVEVF